MGVKQEIETNKYSDHCKLTMVRFDQNNSLFVLLSYVMNVRIPEENIWWIFVVEESDSEDSEDWLFLDSESVDSDSDESE